MCVVDPTGCSRISFQRWDLLRTSELLDGLQLSIHDDQLMSLLAGGSSSSSSSRLSECPTPTTVMVLVVSGPKIPVWFPVGSDIDLFTDIVIFSVT